MYVPKSVIAVFGLCLCLMVQDSQGKKEGKGRKQDKDAQSSVEPRSKPGVGQEFLKKFVGDWKVDKTIRGRNGRENKSTGECKQTMIHDGRFLQSEFTFKTNNGTSTGTGVIGFETSSGSFTSVWIDSRSTKMSLRRSVTPFDGKTIHLVSEVLGDAKAGTNQSRTETHMEDNDQKIIHRSYVLDAEKKERLFMELVMTKIAK